MSIRPRHGFSLATIFLLTTVLAVFGAAARNALLHRQELAQTAGWLAISGAGIGLVTGIWVGAIQPRRWRSMLLGGPVGLMVGAGGAVALAVSENLIVALAGAALLVAFALIVRRNSTPLPEDSSDERKESPESA